MAGHLEVESEYEGGPKEVGTVDVWLEDERESTYLGAFVGRPQAIATRLKDDGFLGLAKHVRGLRSGLVGYLAGMEVRPGLRGRGVGAAMVKEMLEEMRGLGVRVVLLHRSASRDSSDEDLAAFYYRFGFEEVDCCQSDVWPAMKLSL